MIARRARRTQRWWLALSLVAAACSWLVEPEQHPLRCASSTDAGASACPTGLSCRAGHCEPSPPCGERELCGDGVDNDCNGQVDEPTDELCGDLRDNDCDDRVDEGFDEDGDGFTWCGDISLARGGPTRDCEDGFAEIHPRAREQCDGRDNDCDELVDEPGAESLCLPGEVCVKQRCVLPSCAIEGSSEPCSDDEVCDPSSGRCMAGARCPEQPCGPGDVCELARGLCSHAPAPVGAPCASDGECLSGSCFDAAALRLAAGARVCGRACCADRDCGAGERCFAAGTGARSCLPASLLPADLPSQCAADSDCQAGQTCALSSATRLTGPTFSWSGAVTTASCRQAAASAAELGERCESADLDQCATGTCTAGAPRGPVCSAPCGQSADCAPLSQSRLLFGLGAYCGYVELNGEGRSEAAAQCVIARTRVRRAARGEACAHASDCEEGGCVGATDDSPGRCSPTCCNDGQCGVDELGRAISCRPFAFGKRYEMRCDI